MQLTINGAERTIQATSLSSLVKELDVNISHIAIERNGSIIPRSQYEHTALADGDHIELVEFVGGG